VWDRTDQDPERGDRQDWGLTPGCRNSGDVTDRLGSISRQGSATARFILGQLVLHVLRRDGSMRAWCAKIKKRATRSSFGPRDRK